MRVRVLTVELPRWGATTRFSRLSRGSSGSIGSGEGDVERGGGDGLRLQGFVEGDRIHDRAAGGVDEDGGGLHLRQFVGADEVMSLGGQGHVEADEIGLGQQGGHADVLHVVELFGVGLAGAAVVEDSHVEAPGALGHFQADAAHADDADGCLVDFRAKPE